MTAEEKALRLPLIVASASRHRRSRNMREMWRRRRAELQAFIDDERVGGDDELRDLPDTI